MEIPKANSKIEISRMTRRSAQNIGRVLINRKDKLGISFGAILDQVFQWYAFLSSEKRKKTEETQTKHLHSCMFAYLAALEPVLMILTEVVLQTKTIVSLKVDLELA